MIGVTAYELPTRVDANSREVGRGGATTTTTWYEDDKKISLLKKNVAYWIKYVHK